MRVASEGTERSSVVRLFHIATLVVVIALPRIVRSQPVDAGVDAAPSPADASPPSDATPPQPPPPATEEPPSILHQEPPVYPSDLPKAQQRVVDVLVHVEVDPSGAPSN